MLQLSPICGSGLQTKAPAITGASVRGTGFEEKLYTAGKSLEHP